MKKVEMARGNWMSYKRTTIVICSINIFVALYVLHSLYTSVYMYPFSDTQKGNFCYYLWTFRLPHLGFCCFCSKVVCLVDKGWILTQFLGIQ